MHTHNTTTDAFGRFFVFFFFSLLLKQKCWQKAQPDPLCLIRKLPKPNTRRGGKAPLSLSPSCMYAYVYAPPPLSLLPRTHIQPSRQAPIPKPQLHPYTTRQHNAHAYALGSVVVSAPRCFSPASPGKGTTSISSKGVTPWTWSKGAVSCSDS